MSAEKTSWKTAAGQKIHALHWPVANPRAMVCIVHGLGEHIGRYGHVATFFSKNNIATAGLDLPGFGLSEGKRGHITSHEAYLDEITALLENIRQWYPGVPVFLYGQSMGGNLVLNYLFERGTSLAGVIASSPWIRLVNPPSPALIGFAKMMVRIVPSLTQSNELDVNELSNDPAVVEAYRNDPLVHDRISISTGLTMFKAAERIEQFEGATPAPVLLMHGSDDLITDPKGSEYFARRANGKVTFKQWEGLKHELHNEPEQQEVLMFVLKWMKNTMA